MPKSSSPRQLPRLRRIENPSHHVFETPSKKINDADDLRFFFTSKAYRDLSEWLFQLNRAVFPRKTADGKTICHNVDSPPPFSEAVRKLRDLLEALSGFVTQAPPDTGPRRFGNVAFRKWSKLLEDNAASLLDTHLSSAVVTFLEIDQTQRLNLRDELQAYLLGSFGSAQRLDYGTGHELSFLAFLGCLWKLGAFEDGEEVAIVIGIIQPYLDLVRKIIKTYTLEPAGSHGVWGLDDHSFIPYIFGAAQLGPTISEGDHISPVPTEGSLPSALSPSSVTNKATVADYKDSNMYFSAIQFIYDVKKGPFWEHSPVLYDISGIKDGWGKINKGMLKMYAAEVLGKFPVIQHFPLGSLFRWETDPEAAPVMDSVHAQQQPTTMQSKDVPPVVGASTTAPWSRTGGMSRPQPAVDTGVPAMRAPWTSNSGDGPATMRPLRNPGLPPATAPWASTQRQPPVGTVKKDSKP